MAITMTPFNVPLLPPGFFTAAAITVTLYLLLYRLQLHKRHPSEPPIIPSYLPFIGPLVGMALHGGRYIKSIGLSSNHPIFTLPVPFSRIYIVVDPPLAAAVQRASKTLSFTPLVPDITKRVLNLDGRTVEIVRQHLDEPGGFLTDMHDMVYAYLGPGKDLEELSTRAARELAMQVEEFRKETKIGDVLEVPDLLVWIRHIVAQGTAKFIYGTENPLHGNAELEDAFWDFDHGLGGLLMGLFPRWTARKAYVGREKLAAAFEEYLAKGRHLEKGEGGAADVVRERVRIATEHGFDLGAAARSEVSFLFAGIVNTATTTFWTVLQTFARRELVETIRGELWDNAVVRRKEDGDLELDMERLKTACPTLLAVMRECLRLGSDNYSTRLVKTDTDLAGGRYRITKNSVVQIAGGVIHADAGIWGEHAGEFDHGRFLNMKTNGNGNTSNGSAANGDTSGHVVDGQKGHGDYLRPPTRPQVQQTPSGGVHGAAFRAFGGGKTLCPGRHFATYEILAFAAMIVLTFDIESADNSESGIRIPKKHDGVLPVHILEPVEPVKVVVKVRENAGRIVAV